MEAAVILADAEEAVDRGSPENGEKFGPRKPGLREVREGDRRAGARMTREIPDRQASGPVGFRI